MKRLRELDSKACPTYDPKSLLEKLAAHMGTGSDYALANVLQIPPPAISKIRRRKTNITAGVLLRMHDATKVPVDTLREWMGMAPYSADIAVVVVD